MHDIDLILNFHFYTDASKFSANFCIIQFQNQDKFQSQNQDEFQNQDKNKSMKISILFDSFMFTSTKQKYLTYKRKLCAMIQFCIKYAYMLKSSALFRIIYMNHKS